MTGTNVWAAAIENSVPPFHPTPGARLLPVRIIGQPNRQTCRFTIRVSPATCHILLLEDDPAVAAMLEAALKQAGFCNVKISSSIAGARQCWHAQLGKFDVFLTDFSLPHGCVTGLIQELIRSRPELRVILMSGFCEEDLSLESSLSRHLTLLQKPFGASTLVEAVTALRPSALC